MTKYGTRVVEAETLSEAWLDTVQLVAGAPERKLFHTFTLIHQPLTENHWIRARCDELLARMKFPAAETVANTIFPAAMAANAADPGTLVDRYRTMYPVVQRFDGNHSGTYFGRLVAYPGVHGEIDQLGPLIDKLRREASLAIPMSARYEVGMATTEDLTWIGTAEATPVHAVGRDNSRRGFPCLSACSFQLEHHQVHLLAHYRYEYLIRRGYGNYLGLARLLEYVATSAGLTVGQLSIVTGRAHVDTTDANIGRLVHPSLFDED